MSGKLLTLNEFLKADDKTLEAFDNIFLKAKNKKSMMGWVDLPWSDEAYQQSNKWFKKIKKNQKTLCVFGIGGSCLGAKAIYDFLQPKKKILFFSNVDGTQFEKQLSKIKLKQTHFLFISKSGETSETLVQLAHVLALLNKTKLNLREHVSVITGLGSGKLDKIADKFKLLKLDVPKEVGGRFSVLSQVGIAPLLWAGVDIKKILAGAKQVLDYKEQVSALCDFYLKSFEKEKHISVFWFYCDALFTFGLWLSQLWSESLAKAGGPEVSTPLICIGSNDQHSLLQQFNEGKKDKSFLFFRNLESEKSLKIKKVVVDELKLFENKSVGELLKILAQATKQVLKSKKMPVCELIVQDHSPQTIGALIYFFEVLVAVIAERINVNAYNQPGVEDGKRITLGTLGDARYLDLALK
ncbi:MAG: hypothetical protein IPM57_01605 [Oligoflexia bacterium]|nr:hypothetical protein [Oligoflexia bacterium]